MGTAAKRETSRATGTGLRIAVVGASALDVVPDNLLYFLTDGTAASTIVYLRRGLKSKPGMFERLVASWCREMGHPEVRWVLPDPELGAGSVFLRDNELVAASDLVLAFFAPGHHMEGGTGHVVERAIDSGVPVYSWVVGDDISRVGESDPEATWQELIQAWFEEAE